MPAKAGIQTWPHVPRPWSPRFRGNDTEFSRIATTIMLQSARKRHICPAAVDHDLNREGGVCPFSLGGP